MASVWFRVLLALGLGVGQVGGKGFLERGDVSFEDETFGAAMETLMACGDRVDPRRVQEIEANLKPVWQVLPKNRDGRVEWRLMRYLAHRYFLQRYSLLVRGLEPTYALANGEVGNAKLLANKSLAEQALDHKRTSSSFSFEDAKTLILALEKLIHEREDQLLTAAYDHKGKRLDQTMGESEVIGIMETYMMLWMTSDDPQSAEAVMAAPERMEEVIPLWPTISLFIRGLVNSMEFKRQRSAQRGHGRVAMTHHYSRGEAQEVASAITLSFASFWETECQSIKASLVELDRDGSGRVRLSDFYGANTDGQWRFAESEDYLRELGALDESSTWKGKQVIIPNYLQGASNCIVQTSNYLICCVNECEHVLQDIEDEIGHPLGSPSAIMELVSNMTNFDDDKPRIDGSLARQLARIAEVNGGAVPLHGRLFAQWLHHVFPHECPVPLRAGEASFTTPNEFGDYMVTEEDVKKHSARRGSHTRSPQSVDDTLEAQQPWMSEWSEEEELIGDYSELLGSSRAVSLRDGRVVGCALVLLLVGAYRKIRGNAADDISIPKERFHI